MGSDVQLKHVLRIIIPAFSSLLILLVFWILSDSESPYAAHTANAAVGPEELCMSWSKQLADDATEAFSFSNVAVDDLGDLYLGDVSTHNTSGGAIAEAAWRLRKLSASGARVFDTLLYAQLPKLREDRVVENTHDLVGAPVGTPAILTSQINAFQRLFTDTTAHLISDTILVLQQGDFNASDAFAFPGLPTTWFSALSVYSAGDGTCLWGASYTAAASGGGAELTACFGSEGADDSNLRLARVAVSQTMYTRIPQVANCYSWVATVGRREERVQIDAYQLEYPCEAGSQSSTTPTMTHAWSSVVASIEGSASWSTESAFPLVSISVLDLYPIPNTPPTAIIVASYPVVSDSPWPSPTTGAFLNDIVVFNASTSALVWQLSTSLSAGVLSAFVSNIAVSPSGILYVVAIRNNTASAAAATERMSTGSSPRASKDAPGETYYRLRGETLATSQYEAVAVSIDIGDSAILWMTPLLPLAESDLAAGSLPQAVQLAWSASGLVFCANAPPLNVTTGNASIPGTENVEFLTSLLGFGVLELDGGDLLWYDSMTTIFPTGSARPFISSFPSHCSSNLLVDDKNVFAVVTRKFSLGDALEGDTSAAHGSLSTGTSGTLVTGAGGVGEDAPLAFQHALYARTVMNGLVLWSQFIDTAPSAASFTSYATKLANGAAPLATVGAISARLTPTQLSLGPHGRLVLKIDSSAMSAPTPPFYVPPSVLLRSFQCGIGTVTTAVWIYVAIAMIVSLIVFRFALGCLSSCVVCRRYIPNPSPAWGKADPLLAGTAGTAGLGVAGLGVGLGMGMGVGNAPLFSPTMGASMGGGIMSRSAREAPHFPTPSERQLLSAAASGGGGGAGAGGGSGGGVYTFPELPPGNEATVGGSASGFASFTATPPGEEDGIGDDLDELCTLHITRQAKRACGIVADCCLRGVPCAVNCRKFCRLKRGTPWVLLSIIHYITMIALLSRALSTARVSIQSLQGQLESPPLFFREYLINRSPSSADSACVSNIAAACYCHPDTMPGEGNTVSPSTCNDASPQPACAFDLTACTGTCSSMLTQTGYCAASVYSYECMCSASDCAETITLFNNTLRTDSMGGLPAGLQSCASHYDTIYLILTLSFAGYVLFSCLAITYLLSVWKFALLSTRAAVFWIASRFVSPARSRFPRWLRAWAPLEATGPGGGGGGGGGNMRAGGLGLGRPRARSRRESSQDTTSSLVFSPTAASTSGGGGGAGGGLVRLGSNGAMGLVRNSSSGYDSIGRSASSRMSSETGFSHPSTPSHLNPERITNTTHGSSAPSTPLAERYSGSGYQVWAPATPSALEQIVPFGSPSAHSLLGGLRSPAAGVGVGRHKPGREEEKRAILNGPNADLKARSRRVSMLVYLALCQVGTMLGSFVWCWFLVLQGRYCTGADGDASGVDIPIVGSVLPPQASLILRTVPGCVFGSAWQDADYEGAALRSVWLAMAGQALAMLLLVCDQGFALLQACCMRCNVVARQQLYTADQTPAAAGTSPAAAAATASKEGASTAAKPWCWARSAQLGSWQQLLDTRMIFVPEVWQRACGLRACFCCVRTRTLPLPTSPAPVGPGTALLGAFNGADKSHAPHDATQPQEGEASAGTTVECGIPCCMIFMNGPDNVAEWVRHTSDETLM